MSFTKQLTLTAHARRTGRPGRVQRHMPSFLAASPARAACTTVYEVQPSQFVDDIEDWWPDTRDEPRLSLGSAAWEGSVYSGLNVPPHSRP